MIPGCILYSWYMSKFLYENADNNKGKRRGNVKTSNLSNSIIDRPPQSRETIPLGVCTW